MPTRKASAEWNGTLREGSGNLSLGSGVYEGPYTWAGRFADGPGTNPEELVGAAHAGCYAMFFSALLSKEDGCTINSIKANAAVTVETVDGPTITTIIMDVEASVDGVSDEKFNELAQSAKEKCPVSKALAAVPNFTLNVKRV